METTEKEILDTLEKDMVYEMTDEDLIILGRAIVEENPIIKVINKWRIAKEQDSYKYMQAFALSSGLTERASGVLLGVARCVTKDMNVLFNQAVKKAKKKEIN